LRRFVPHLHTFSTLRSAGLLHPQYRFIPFHSASYVPLHSSRIMSVTLYFFSGCSFAQPSGLAPLALCPKSRNAKGCLLFSPRSSTLLLLHFASRPSPAAILGFRWLFDCRNPATALLVPKKSGLRCLGVFDSRFHNKVPRETSTRR
jgi:hypothetical protein